MEEDEIEEELALDDEDDFLEELDLDD